MHVSMNGKVALCVYTIRRVFTYPVNCDITLTSFRFPQCIMIITFISRLMRVCTVRRVGN
jgi:hypothetical protein